MATERVSRNVTTTDGRRRLRGTVHASIFRDSTRNALNHGKE